MPIDIATIEKLHYDFWDRVVKWMKKTPMYGWPMAGDSSTIDQIKAIVATDEDLKALDEDLCYLCNYFGSCVECNALFNVACNQSPSPWWRITYLALYKREYILFAKQIRDCKI